jgi:hypothetical protein
MKNFYSKVRNTVAVILAVLVLVITGILFAQAINAVVVSKVYEQASLAWALNLLTIPLAVAALWLMDCKKKTRIIGEAFMFGFFEHMAMGLVVFAMALECGYLLRAISWAIITFFVLFLMLIFGRYWNVSRRIAEGTYVDEDDEEELREQEAALREMLS